MHIYIPYAAYLYHKLCSKAPFVISRRWDTIHHTGARIVRIGRPRASRRRIEHGSEHLGKEMRHRR